MQQQAVSPMWAQAGEDGSEGQVQRCSPAPAPVPSAASEPFTKYGTETSP